MQVANKLKTILLATVLLGTLTACGVFQEAATPEAPPEMVPDDSVISVTGLFVPETFASLSVAVPGLVDAVLVEEGQAVEEGEQLIVLRGAAQSLAIQAAAELELESARQAIDALYTSAELQNANLRLALWDAQAQMIAAEEAWKRLDTDDYQDDITEAQEDVIEAEEDLQEAQKTFDRYADLDEDNPRRVRYEEELQEAQDTFDKKVRVREALIIELERAKAAWVLATKAVELAEADYSDTLAGPDPEDLALAEARLANAEAQLAAAQAAVTEDTSLRAPFAGTVMDLSVHVGEWANPGMPVLLLADLDTFRIETTDLNEIDIVRIAGGDSAMVTFDALPNRVFDGTVMELSPKASAGLGVNYTVVIELREIPEEARWGMTAFVDIEVGE